MRRRHLLLGTAASVMGGGRPALAQTAGGGTLRFVPQANLSALDPVWTTATVTNNHGYTIFDTLYGADMALAAQPQMAEGHTVSADGLAWTFTLREGLLFHDGTPVRPADCIASLKRWCQRDVFGQLLAAVTVGWSVTGERAFTVRLTRPFAPMLDALAKVDNPAFIMPERLAATDATKQVTEMVGSGPYRFVAGEYNSGSRAVYQRFDGYRPRPEPPSRNAGGKVAHFARLEWQVIPDPATAAAALVAGEVDWWERPLADLQPMLATAAGVRRQVTDPSGRMAVLRMNCLQPPFDNPAVRKAVRLAVRQEDYMRATQGDDATAWKVCRSLWGTSTPYYTGEQADLMPGDLAAAQAALKASGYAGQKVVVISPTDYADIGPLGSVTADLLRRMGMTVDLQEMDWGSVIQRRNSREPVEHGGWSIFHTTGGTIGWGNPAGSQLVRGQGAAGWFGWWRSEKAEALAQDWLLAPAAGQQHEAAVSLGRLALEEVATVPLGIFTVRTAFRTDLSDMLPGSAPYFWGLRRG